MVIYYIEYDFTIHIQERLLKRNKLRYLFKVFLDPMSISTSFLTEN